MTWKSEVKPGCARILFNRDDLVQSRALLSLASTEHERSPTLTGHQQRSGFLNGGHSFRYSLLRRAQQFYLEEICVIGHSDWLLVTFNSDGGRGGLLEKTTGVMNNKKSSAQNVLCGGLRPEWALLHLQRRRTLLEPGLAQLEHVAVREHLQDVTNDALRLQAVAAVELALAVGNLGLGAQERVGRGPPDFPEQLRSRT